MAKQQVHWYTFVICPACVWSNQFLLISSQLQTIPGDAKQDTSLEQFCFHLKTTYATDHYMQLTDFKIKSRKSLEFHFVCLGSFSCTHQIFSNLINRYCKCDPFMLPFRIITYNKQFPFAVCMTEPVINSICSLGLVHKVHTWVCNRKSCKPSTSSTPQNM